VPLLCYFIEFSSKQIPPTISLHESKVKKKTIDFIIIYTAASLILPSDIILSKEKEVLFTFSLTTPHELAYDTKIQRTLNEQE